MAKTPTHEGLNILIRRKAVGLSQKDLVSISLLYPGGRQADVFRAVMKK